MQDGLNCGKAIFKMLFNQNGIEPKFQEEFQEVPK